MMVKVTALIFTIIVILHSTCIAQHSGDYKQEMQVEGLRLSRAVYSQNVPSGWGVISPIKKEQSGLQWAVYENKKTGQRVLAFTGTGPGGIKDWATNFDNAIEGSMLGKLFGLIDRAFPQVQHCEALQITIRQKYIASTEGSKQPLMIVGHSKGGSIAQYVGASLRLPTYVYNSTPLGLELLSHIREENKDWANHGGIQHTNLKTDGVHKIDHFLPSNKHLGVHKDLNMLQEDLISYKKNIKWTDNSEKHIINLLSYIYVYSHVLDGRLESALLKNAENYESDATLQRNFFAKARIPKGNELKLRDDNSSNGDDDKDKSSEEDDDSSDVGDSSVKWGGGGPPPPPPPPPGTLPHEPLPAGTVFLESKEYSVDDMQSKSNDSSIFTKYSEYSINVNPPNGTDIKAFFQEWLMNMNGVPKGIGAQEFENTISFATSDKPLKVGDMIKVKIGDNSSNVKVREITDNIYRLEKISNFTTSLNLKSPVNQTYRNENQSGGIYEFGFIQHDNNLVTFYMRELDFAHFQEYTNKKIKIEKEGWEGFMQGIGERFGINPIEARSLVYGSTRFVHTGYVLNNLPSWVRLRYYPIKSYVPFSELQGQVGIAGPPEDPGPLISK